MGNAPLMGAYDTLHRHWKVFEEVLQSGHYT